VVHEVLTQLMCLYLILCFFNIFILMDTTLVSLYLMISYNIYYMMLSKNNGYIQRVLILYRTIIIMFCNLITALGFCTILI